MRVIKFVGRGGQEYLFPKSIIDYSDDFASVVARATELPGTSGAFPEYGIAAPAQGIGSVRFQYRIITEDRTKMDGLIQKVKAMSAWGMGQLFVEADGEELYCWCVITDPIVPRNLAGHSDLWQEVSISATAYYPFWIAQGTEAILWGQGALWGAGATWGGTASWNAVAGEETTLTVTVGGGTMKTPPRINFECETGQSAENIRVARVVGGVVVDEVSYTDVMTAGDMLGINTRSQTVTLNSVNAYDVATFDYLRGGWFALEPGDNAIRVRMENGGDAGRIRFSYYELYRGL